jgi:hypothetical protein
MKDNSDFDSDKEDMKKATTLMEKLLSSGRHTETLLLQDSKE